MFRAALLRKHKENNAKNNLKNTGAWPSGKAAVFGIAIRRFDPCRPSQNSFGKLVQKWSQTPAFTLE